MYEANQRAISFHCFEVYVGVNLIYRGFELWGFNCILLSGNLGNSHQTTHFTFALASAFTSVTQPNSDDSSQFL